MVRCGRGAPERRYRSSIVDSLIIFPRVRYSTDRIPSFGLPPPLSESLTSNLFACLPHFSLVRRYLRPHRVCNPLWSFRFLFPLSEVWSAVAQGMFTLRPTSPVLHPGGSLVVAHGFPLSDAKITNFNASNETPPPFSHTLIFSPIPPDKITFCTNQHVKSNALLTFTWPWVWATLPALLHQAR